MFRNHILVFLFIALMQNANGQGQKTDTKSFEQKAFDYFTEKMLRDSIISEYDSYIIFPGYTVERKSYLHIVLQCEKDIPTYPTTEKESKEIDSIERNDPLLFAKRVKLVTDIKFKRHLFKANHVLNIYRVVRYNNYNYVEIFLASRKKGNYHMVVKMDDNKNVVKFCKEWYIECF